MAANTDAPGVHKALKILGVVLLWVVGSTVIGYTALYFSGWGHAGGLFLYAAWFIAIAGLPIHLVWLMRRRASDAKQ